MFRSMGFLVFLLALHLWIFYVCVSLLKNNKTLKGNWQEWVEIKAALQESGLENFVPTISSPLCICFKKQGANSRLLKG